MIRYILIFCLTIFSTQVFAQAGAIDTSFLTGYGSGAQHSFCLSIEDIELDDEGNYYVGGDFTYFDSMSYKHIVKLRPNGTIDPTFIIGDGTNEHVIDINFYPDGDLLLAGEFGFYDNTSRVGLARISKNGALKSSFVPSSQIQNYVTKALILSNKRVVIGDSRNIFRLNSNGSRDMSFPLIEIFRNTSNRHGYINDMVLQGTRYIVVGNFIRLNQSDRKYIARINSNGTINTDFKIGSGFDKMARAIEILETNKILVGGDFSEFDGHESSNIVRLNFNGSFDPTFQVGSGFSSDGRSEVYDIEELSDGKILVSGSFTSYNGYPCLNVVRLLSNGQVDSTFISSNGAKDSFCSQSSIYKVVEDENGDYVLGGFFENYNGIRKNNIAKVFGSCNTSFHNVNIEACDSVWIGDRFIKQATNFTDSLISSYSCDSIVTYTISISSSIQTNESVSICENEEYQGYTESGTYMDIYNSINGCDSIHTIVLEVLPIAEENLSAEICDGEEYLGYTKTGVYQDTFAAPNGCDSLRIIDLIVNSPKTSFIQQNICYGASFAGYDSSGIYVDTFSSSLGCDSITTLDLTVFPEEITQINQEICEGESYHGYVSSGTYADTLVNLSGCDSIRIIDLEVHSLKEIEIVQVICDGESHEGYTTSGIYRDTLLSSFACDSVRILDLTVNPIDTMRIEATICEGETYEGYTQTGIYLDTLLNINNCDSLVEINLTVLDSTDVLCTPLGLNEVSEINVQLYPNPTTKVLYVSIDQDITIKSVDLVNYIGQQIDSYYDYKLRQLDIRSDYKGLAIVRITTDQGAYSKCIVLF